MSKMLYGKRWPEDFPNRFFIGMHTVDTDQNGTIPHLLSDFDGRRTVRELADAGVDAIYFYASCHCGNCYYPSEVPPAHVHGGLKGRDVFGEAADECQKRKIAFIGVYEFMHLRLVDFGPREWMHYYPAAGPTNKGKMCWNTGYGEFVAKQVEELARRYPMAGMYVDMLDHADVVCCEGCARRFKDEVGVAPPRVQDIADPLYKVFRLWTFRDTARYLNELRAILRSGQPDATLVLNSHLLQCEDLYETSAANDYVSTDPGIGFNSNYGTARLASLMALFQAVSRGKNRFEILSDPITLGVFSVAPPDPYNASVSQCAAHGAFRGYPSSMIDRVGRLNPYAVRLARKAVTFAQERQPWEAVGEPVRFAGLYISQESELFYGGSTAAGARLGASPYLDEFIGAYHMLQEEHLPVDVLTRRDLGRLAEYPVVILPNAVCMSDAEMAAFREYVKGGGTLVASYRTSLANEWNEPRPDFGLADVLGVHYAGRKIEPYIGMQMPLPDGLYDTEDWENRNISLPQAALICTLAPGARQVIALHDRHRTDPSKHAGCLHNSYTKEKPEGPAVVETRLGKGRCVYFAGKIFSGYLYSGNPSLRKLAVRWVIGDERRDKLPLRLIGPASVELTAYAQPDRNRVLMHLVNFQTCPGRMQMNTRDGLPMTEDVLPVHDTVLEVAFPPADIVSAVLQPAGQPLEVVARPGGAAVRIPVIRIHDIVELTLKPGACPVYPDSNRVFPCERYDLRKKAREWLASKPAGYDPKDSGALSFDRWRPAEDFLTNWKMAGPFRPLSGTGMETDFGPETDAALERTYKGIEGQPVAWRDFSGVERHENGFVEMCWLMDNRKGLVGYVRSVLRSAEAQRVTFWLGNNDACKVSVNGAVVYQQAGDKHTDRGSDLDSFAVDLNKGDNVVLVKVENVGHGMGFFLRLDDLTHEVICASGPDDPGRKVVVKKAERVEWSGRGEMQI